MFHGARDTIRRNMPVIAFEINEAAMADALSKDVTLPDEVRIQYSTEQCSTALLSTVRCGEYCAVLCGAVQCSTVRCSEVQCSAVR
jgi:hypothetical protein